MYNSAILPYIICRILPMLEGTNTDDQRVASLVDSIFDADQETVEFSHVEDILELYALKGFPDDGSVPYAEALYHLGEDEQLYLELFDGDGATCYVITRNSSLTGNATITCVMGNGEGARWRFIRADDEKDFPELAEFFRHIAAEASNGTSSFFDVLAQYEAETGISAESLANQAGFLFDQLCVPYAVGSIDDPLFELPDYQDAQPMMSYIISTVGQAEKRDWHHDYVDAAYIILCATATVLDRREREDRRSRQFKKLTGMTPREFLGRWYE